MVQPGMVLHTPIILGHRRLRQEDHDSKGSLDYRVRPGPQKQTDRQTDRQTEK